MQIGWVAHHLADLESDMSAIHRVDDMYAMDAPRFLRMAWRLGYYSGAIQHRVQAAREEATAEPAPPAAAPTQAVPSRAVSRTPGRPVVGNLPAGASLVPVSAIAMQPDGQLVEMVRVPKA